MNGPVTVTTLPLDMIMMIADFASWLPLREVCRKFRRVIVMNKDVRIRYWRNVLMYGDVHQITYIFVRYINVLMPDLNESFSLDWRRCVFSTVHCLASRGDVEMLVSMSHIYSTTPNVGAELACVAAEYGRMDMLKYVYKCYGDLPLYLKVRDGDVEILEWLRETAGEEQFGDRQFRLVHSGRFKTLKWIHSIGITIHPDALMVALSEGAFELVEWLVSIGVKPNDNMLEGNISPKATDWLLDRGCKWTDTSLCGPIRWDNISTIEYFVKKGCPMNLNSARVAAISGKLDALQWMLDHGCPYDSNVLCLLWEYNGGDPVKRRRLIQIIDRLAGRVRPDDIQEVMEELTWA